MKKVIAVLLLIAGTLFLAGCIGDPDAAGHEILHGKVRAHFEYHEY